MFPWHFSSLICLQLQVLLTELYPAATKAFEVTVAAAEPKVLSNSGAIVGSQISFKEAYERLEEFDIMIVPGGGVDAIIKAKAEPLKLISAYSDIQKKDPAREYVLGQLVRLQ